MQEIQGITPEFLQKQMALSALEVEMLKHEQVECPVIHRFGPGVYIREVRLPSGCIALGHRQKYSQMNIFLKGRVRMFNENGSVSELSAPMIFTGPPGRKVGMVLEDVVWLNVYATDETDVATLESTFLDKSEGWTDAERRLIDKVESRSEDADDYQKMLTELEVTEKQVRQQSENEEDQIPMPYGDYKIIISDSFIEGKGVFATASIKKGETIGPARIAGMRTPIGRYCNHSAKPNSKMVKVNGDIYLVAATDIAGCRGGFLGEEITTDYRSTRKLLKMET